MAHFQLPKKDWRGLFSQPTRFFAIGNTGREQIGLHPNRSVQIEMVSSTKSPKSLEILSDKESVVKISKVDGSGSTRLVTIETRAAGDAQLIARDPTGGDKDSFPLHVRVGEFKRHPTMSVDLIADVCNGSDLAKIYTLRRMLYNNWDNYFNESNEHWQSIFPGQLPCGSVCKMGGIRVFHKGTNYDYHAYYKPIVKPKNRPLDFKDIVYVADKIRKGRLAIQRILTSSKRPIIVGCVYNPAVATLNRYRTIEVTRSGGHTVLVVGVSSDGRTFLYIDVYADSSHLKYDGGIAGEFGNTVIYLGEFVADEANATPRFGKSSDTKGSWPLALISGPRI